jgi:DNA-binding response OmpR family regulator
VIACETVASHTALIVDPRPEEMSAAATRLRALGCTPAVVCTFEEAKTCLAHSADLSLMITAVRLREFNGVHLALRGRTLFPRARIVVTDYVFDPVIEREALRLGAEYILKPIDPSNVAALLSAVNGQHSPGGARRWDRRLLPVGGRAAVGNWTARVLDVSYGGMRLEVPRQVGECLPHAVSVSLPAVGLDVRVRPIWAKCAADADLCECGAELLQMDERSTDRWQNFVDAL